MYYNNNMLFHRQLIHLFVVTETVEQPDKSDKTENVLQPAKKKGGKKGVFINIFFIVKLIL